MPVPRRKFKSGFTLVELLVTISIFVILTGVVLFNQAKFNSTILLTNLAYDTALTIRQAQTYGINIKNFNLNNENKFTPYGVHFDMNATTSFILFADLDYNPSTKATDGIYDGLSNNEPNLAICETDMGCVNRYSIKRGSYISELCRTPGNSDQVQCDVDSVDIVFKRPNPDAILTVIKNNGQMPNPAASAVHIKLTSADGSNTRTVVVQENGLIYIQPVTAN